MNFTNLSVMTFAAGLAGLAALLYLLQRLRIRYSEIEVPTTLFWAEAVREAPVRVFRKRFRHWLAYLLSLLIVALLWTGFAGPEATESRSGGYHVLFLDGSAGMSTAGQLEQAVDALKGDLSGLPDDRREVIWGGAYNLKILDAGEDRILLDQRLQALSPEAAPSAVEKQLQLLSQPGAYAEHVEFVIYGRAAVSQATLDMLPAGVQVARADLGLDASDNTGIIAFGAAEAASGAWDRVDVLIQIAGSEGQPVDAMPEFLLNGEALEQDAETTATPGQLYLRDLPAGGGVLEARLGGGDAVAADDTARLRLPQRSIIRVALSGAIPQSVWRVIEADPGLVLAPPAQADVVVREAGEPYGEGTAALELSRMGDQQAAFALSYNDLQDAELALQAAVASIGLDQVDHSGLATVANRPIEARIEAADQRGVMVWRELLGEQFNFIQSRSFPIFVARSIRWLAGSEQEFPYLAAGRAVVDRGRDRSLGAPAGQAFDVLDAEFFPPRGEQAVVARDGTEWPVSLLSAATSRGSDGVELESRGLALSEQAAGAGLISWLILAVLVLLIIEWMAYRKGQMP